MFDDATNNFFVLNDTHANGAVDFFVMSPHEDQEPPGKRIRSPSETGLVVFRTLVNDEKNLAAIDKARRQAKCALL